MWLKEGEFHVRLGGQTFINVPKMIMFGDIPLFAVYRQEDGYLAIDFEVYGSDGEHIATIKKNNIYRHDKSEFSFDGSAEKSVLYAHKPGSAVKTPIVEISKRAAAAPAELDVSLTTALPDGRVLRAGPESCSIPGLFMRNIVLRNCAIGLQITPLPSWGPSNTPPQSA